MDSELKEILDSTCGLFDFIDEKSGLTKKIDIDGKLSDILKFELMCFLCCLSACDKRISRVEAALIRNYFDVEMYPIHIKEFNNKQNIGSENFYNKVPQCLAIAVAVDNYMVERNGYVERCTSDIVIEVFKAFGKAMVVADEKVKAEEQICWSRYITMMTQYIADNSKVYKNDPRNVPRPGAPIDVKYDVSLDKIGRTYTLYIGKFPIE